MNIDNIKNLIEVLKETETYDQSEWFHPCGTPGCIGGHAAMLMKPDTIDCDTPYELALEYLGLNETQAMGLFTAFPFMSIRARATVKDAINTLEHLIETGEVMWLKDWEHHEH